MSNMTELTSRSEDSKIRELHSIWITAVNAGDLTRLLTLMAADAVFLGPGQTPFGRDGFSAGFSTAHQRKSRIDCISVLEEVVVVGEIAYARSRDTLSLTGRDTGKVTQFAGYRIAIYRKQTDSHWLLARDIHTLTPQAPGGIGSS